MWPQNSFNRPGGYTRIIKLGIRVGDNAEIAMIELVDFNEVYGKTAVTAAEPAKRTRRRGAGAKKATTATAAEAQEETTTTEVEPEVATENTEVATATEETAAPAAEENKSEEKAAE